ncbi:MAG: 2,4-dihydroxyhept-2-ene-1,7-dioic acid aldolase [Nitrospirae bacterium]|nr:2,4-dihydroxyhept-2-ene-1,7-dioic acid aldolase [Magnetococcales bacterium]HAT51103.1 2,4-dihydroxyhept-2-ene-1,7-dioic acid aldolase [Alphaproteobacteria bacterium]
MNLKKRLQEGILSVGSWISLAHPAHAEIMAKSGFDWLALDMEHSVISLAEAEAMIRIIELCGVTPLVRLTANDPNQIKRIMDSGAHGIIVPMVKSAEESQAAVRAVRYPPQGNRSVGLARAQGYGARFHPYREWQAEQSIVIVQIEHIDAMKDLKGILSVDGVDGYFIGPYDLTGSMGITGQFNHPDYLAVVNEIQQTGKALGKPGGIHVIEPNLKELRSRIEEGHRFIAYSVDFRIMDVACREGIAVVQSFR